MGETTTLLCLTFAGGDKYSYRHLFERTPSIIELITPEYLGFAQASWSPQDHPVHQIRKAFFTTQDGSYIKKVKKN